MKKKVLLATVLFCLVLFAFIIQLNAVKCTASACGLSCSVGDNCGSWGCGGSDHYAFCSCDGVETWWSCIVR